MKGVEPSLEGRSVMYRMFGEDGALLYVGATYRIAERCRIHAATSWWFPLVTKTRWQFFGDMKTALEAESAAIKSERPLFNVQGRVFYEDQRPATVRAIGQVMPFLFGDERRIMQAHRFFLKHWQVA